jgi:hypothetical protein
MHLDFELMKDAKIRVAEDKLTRIVTGIAEAAVRNKKLGLAVKEVVVRPPEVVDSPDGGTRHRYPARVRLGQTKARRAEKSVKDFRHAFGILAKRAKGKGWELLGEPPRDPAALPDATRPPRPPFELPELTPELVAEVFAGIFDRDAHRRIIHDAVQTFLGTGRRQEHSVPVLQVAVRAGERGRAGRLYRRPDHDQGGAGGLAAATGRGGQPAGDYCAGRTGEAG